MMNALALRRSTNLLALLAGLTLAGMGGFECSKIAHYLLEPDCPGRTSNDETRCPFCAIFSYMVGETPVAVEAPAPPESGVLPLPEAAARAAAIPALPGQSRSPPRSA